MQSSSDSVVCAEVRESIAILSLNRPARSNAWGPDMSAALLSQLERIENDQSIRACVITGHGQRSFSSGVDVDKKQASQETIDSTMHQRRDSTPAVFAALLSLDKPVVAAVNGYAIGAGFLLALSCDVILASQNASFALPQVSLGILPAYGGMPRLAQWIGRGRAMEFALSGRRMPSDEARQIGLLSGLSAPEDLLFDAVTLAEQLGRLPSLAFRAAKESMNVALESGGISASALKPSGVSRPRRGSPR